MLPSHVARARAETQPPWDEARAARILERAIATRRSARHRWPVAWGLAALGVPLLFLLVRGVSGSGGRSPESGTIEPSPATVGGPVDTLDGGKQTG